MAFVMAGGASDPADLLITVDPNPCLERISINPGTTINAALSIDDCQLSSTFFDFYTIFLPEAGQLTVSMRSQAIDSFVVVVTTDLGTVLAEDDDSGGGSDALLTTTLSAGNYVVVATSFDAGETGPYSLATQFVVPEPSAGALGLAAVATLVLIARARRTRHR